MDNKRLYKLMPWLVLALLICASFVFFQWFYPYHLFRREHTMIFMVDRQFIGAYFERPGWLAALTGDFLTQFFYFVGIGALTISVLLGALWSLVWLNVRILTSNRLIPVCVATAVVLWEFFRETGSSYSLDSTLALIGAFALLIPVLRAKGRVAAPLLSVLCLALCYWCFGYAAFVLAAALIIASALRRQWVVCALGILAVVLLPKASLSQQQWWNKPDFALEHKLAIDSEMYFGNWNKVMRLTTEGEPTKYSSFYYYLMSALSGNLPQAVSTRMPKDPEVLLPSMDQRRNSIDLSALGEAWYYMGDLTAAEHCTIVAMISSTRYTGSRYLKRLAEINLAKGDNEAAMKYLRMLSKTICHSKWAASRMPGAESDVAKANRDDVRRFVVESDTVRYVNDYTRSLRHLLKGHPENDMAYDFLLCQHLLRRDIRSFMEDFDPSRPAPRLYQEALLIHLAINNASEEELEKYDVSDLTLDDFKTYNQLLLANSDDSKVQLARQFGNTYWYYYQIPQQ